MLKIPSPLLRQIHDANEVVAPSGERVPMANAGAVAWNLAEAMYDLVRTHKPARVLEVGMASGISSLAMLTALAEVGDVGTLTSIDPFQSTLCRGVGAAYVRQAGFAARHRLIEEPDYVALPALLSAGEKFDLIYIDGNHDFEHVILDAFYADLLLHVGGLVGFNDCGWLSVHAAMKHVPSAARYTEVDVGLKRSYRGRNLLTTVQRWATGRSSSDRYFRKAE